MKTKIFVILLLLVIMCSGCDLFNGKDKIKLNEDISIIGGEIDTNIALLKNNTDPKIVTKNLTKTRTKITKAEKKAKTLQIKTEEASQENKKETQKMIRQIMFFCFIGLGISIAIGFLGNPKIGIAIGGACMGTLLFATSFNTHLVLISWIGLGIFLLIIGFILWKTYIQQKNIYKKDKAIEETIATTELAKTMMDKESKDKLFGKEGEVGLAGKIQNPETVSIIKDIKTKMPELWKIIKKEKKNETNT
jgi:hypothetical protein